jgi:hypothetical protein
MMSSNRQSTGARQRLQRFRAIVSGQNPEPLGLEEVTQHLDDGDFVVDHEHGGLLRLQRLLGHDDTPAPVPFDHRETASVWHGNDVA